MPPHEPPPPAARRDAPAAKPPAPSNAGTQPDQPPLPYRFMGTSVTGTQTAVVLFGRGRVITITGPGRVDDDYVVEHLFDDYLVIRHLPTGRGQFLRFTR